MSHESITKAVIKGHADMLKECADILPGAINVEKSTPPLKLCHNCPYEKCRCYDFAYYRILLKKPRRANAKAK